jgi:enterochelin esterase family protein
VTLLCERPGDPRVRLWRSSSGDARVPLVVFFDGEAHLDRMHTPAVLRAAEREGLLPGIAAVFVDAGARRAHDLGLPGGQSEWVASRLVPRLHREGVLGEVAPEQTIVVGSSFGGLSALFALAHARGTITAAVAQSTSFWRFPDALDDALARAYSGTGMRVRLQAGRYEGAGPARSRALAERLADVGVDASARVVSGGHDWTWWVPEAVIDLGRLLRSPTEAPEAAPRPSR